ncbi:MAG: ShlB/FhaC/HecB family hemolysin secretion/activation protein [Panacagrimonas sp.]
MPIVLPSPLPPVQGSADQIQQQGSAIVTASVQGVQLHVIGPDVMDKALLEAAITSASSMSDAVRLIQGLYYAAGYPAAGVVYALAEPNLYVLVTLGKVTKVEAPEPYDKYFAGVVGADPLTDEALEPRRTLASIYADRAGESVNPTLIPDEAGGAVLRLEPTDNGPSRSTVGAEFGNPGNRFVGRYFVDYFARHSFTTGDEIKATGRHALEGISDDNESADGYNEHALGWSKVTTLGLFGLTGRYVAYQQDFGTSLDGEIIQGELGWQYLVAADFSKRWTVGAKADYTRKDFSTTFEELTIQRQEYGSAELSTDYALALNPTGVRTDITVSLAVRSGLGDDKTDVAVTAADLGYLLFRPTLTARAQLSEYFALGLAATGQYSGDTLPEQQQWVIGGVGNVEAYLPGVAAGDTGGLARAQIELTSIPLGAFTLTPRVFAEYGFATFENDIAGQESDDQTLADAGVSLSFTYGKYLDGSVSYAESFEEDGIPQEVLDQADANVFFRIGAKF